MVNKIDENFHQRRAEALSYVYFSRLNNLIIKETGEDSPFFDYLVDIGNSHNQQTGRLFGIHIKAFQNGNLNKKITTTPYKNIDFPVLNVFFDTHKDIGFYNWIKKPSTKGDLKLEKSEQDIKELTNESLKTIIETINFWYSTKNKEQVLVPNLAAAFE
jgi:hypothetical protein